MRLQALLFVVGCLATNGPALVGAGSKKKRQSHSEARKCAVCDWMVSHLQQRADEEKAAGTSYEMGWRLKDDGTRVAKRVAWAQSELGFGAAVEAACAVSSDDSYGSEAAALQALVQVAMGNELRLRLPESTNEQGHTLRDEPLDLFQSSCFEFVFEDEDALDAIRDQDKLQLLSRSPQTGLSPEVLMAREVCTNRAKVCPKGRWQRWYGPDASPDGQALVPHVPSGEISNGRKNANDARGSSPVARWMYVPFQLYSSAATCAPLVVVDRLLCR